MPGKSRFVNFWAQTRDGEKGACRAEAEGEGGRHFFGSLLSPCYPRTMVLSHTSRPALYASWFLLLLTGGLTLFSMGCSAPETKVVEPAELAVVVEKPLPKPKNIILITIDTLRADYLGTYGGPAKTPVLDSLANDGWLFEQSFSATMLTNPSHASIMTSLYARDHGVYNNEGGIADGVRTLAGTLQKKGMQTGAVINFPHLNPEVVNLGQGFDTIIRATRNERRASGITKEALALVDRMGPDSPHFLWLHYTDPHAPYEPEGKFGNKPDAKISTSKALKAAPGFQKNNPWFKKAFKKIPHVEDFVARYVAEIEATDAGLGELVAGLKERDSFADTLFVITADHGENMGEHGLYFHHGGLYMPTVHVPLIISIPGLEKQRVKHLVEAVDIAPTILDFVDTPGWEPMRGYSLIDLVKGEITPRKFTFSEHMLAQQVSVRSHEGTLILHRKSTGQFPSYRFKSGTVEVYDRINDPLETTPISPDSELGRTLQEALDDYLRAGLGMSARAALWQDRESLKALGYIE